jgi:hypothetical protein
MWKPEMEVDVGSVSYYVNRTFVMYTRLLVQRVSDGGHDGLDKQLG